ncbi:wax ester/triacylglycerol synthase family O-acyltransferase [Mycobacterium sp. E2733]|uniref:wax ester/triacylglycerol synthase family O-acyltransferase n=1 Tax=Mycobacterium sp. E2733 TaxID=1834138 RepID=UPI0007FE0065|nr:wax ester/triacylglycerol synthase family O-acyltransferase [Mycobacterium sp. E2733]OBI00519.1 diacylglycerol O-acyltransferase [Mycobacterium sp. E2733]
MKRLNGWDALLLYSETPNVHQHTLKIAVVDTAAYQHQASFVRFRDTVREQLNLLEPLRYQLVDIPWHLHRPMWNELSDVDLNYHLRRVEVPAPGGRRQLDQVIGWIASTPLDRSRPLWEMYFAEGLAERRIAVITKMHHALADGVASANLLARAMKWPDTAAEDTEAAGHTAPATTPELIRAAGRDRVRLLRRLPGLVRHSAQRFYLLVRRSWQRQRHPELARQLNPPRTFLNHKLSPGRTFASATLSLPEVKDTTKHLRVTINDLVLAMAAGSLRDLLLRYDGHAERPVIASVPTATDSSPDRITGNALGTMLVSLPVHIGDPLERVQLTAVGARLAKDNYELLGPSTVGRWLEYVPAAATLAAFRWTSWRQAPNPLLNVVVSNVPGPRRRGRIAGAEVTEIYSVGPLAAGAALNITVWSYVDQLGISVLSDDQTLRDIREVTDAMINAFAAIRAAAGLPAPHTTIAGAMPR